MPRKSDGQRYERWKLVEQQRRWAIMLKANPIVTIPLEDRVMQETTSLVEAFWHRIGCKCGSCEGPFAKKAKDLRMSLDPVPPAIISLASPLPQLPHQAELPLLAFEAEARLMEDGWTLLPGGTEEQPYDPEDS